MIKKTPTFDYSNCLSCGICAQECPISCLSMTCLRKQGKYSNVFPELSKSGCLGCGRCSQACPMDVITMVENES